MAVVIGTPPGPGMQLIDGAWLNAVTGGQNQVTLQELSGTTCQFGSSTQFFPEEGNVFRFASAGTNPASTGANIVMAVLSLAANAFDGIGNRGLTLTCQGSFANNTNVKTVSIVFGATTAVVGSAVTGGTTLISTGAFSTAALTGFLLTASVFKYGVANSNTQIGLPQGIILGSTHGGVGAGAAGIPVALTATENAPILIAVIGNAATAATDITLNFAEYNAMN